MSDPEDDRIWMRQHEIDALVQAFGVEAPRVQAVSFNPAESFRGIDRSVAPIVLPLLERTCSKPNRWGGLDEGYRYVFPRAPGRFGALRPHLFRRLCP